MESSLRSVIVGVAAGLSMMAGCGGGKPAAPPRPPPSPGPTVDPVAPHPPPADPVAIPPRPAAPPDRSPELFAPAWTAVGVGQTASFSTAAIDPDLDDVRVMVTAMPASARFDALTQTITWTPTRADLPEGTFELEISQPGRETPPVEVTWKIAVSKKKVAPPVAPPASDAAETLFTIRDPARLAAAAKAYPFDTMLAAAARMQRDLFPPEVAAKLGKKIDKAALYRSFLAALAETHGNPRLDPGAPQFDKASFGKPSAWRLVAVRPRIDKAFHELRLVYQAVAAPEPVFAMFRVRPVLDLPTLPPEARAVNNQVFAELFWKHLLTADGAVDPRLVENKRAHARAVRALVAGVIDHRGDQPWERGGFLALATAARMGGGSARDADGNYLSGDGWAWAVTKPLVAGDGTSQAYVDLGFPGFWTRVVPSADGSRWVAKCAPAFDPDDPKHQPGYQVLCRKAKGFVDLPGEQDGKVASAKLDAANLFRPHKTGPAQALLPLDDGRRDLGEENGMTCAQCHTRSFGVRDYADPATVDPRAGTPRAPNRPLPTTAFQIVPTFRWEAFTLDFMQDQECKARVHLEEALGRTPQLDCALADPAAPRVTAPLPP